MLDCPEILNTLTASIPHHCKWKEAVQCFPHLSAPHILSDGSLTFVYRGLPPIGHSAHIMSFIHNSRSTLGLERISVYCPLLVLAAYWQPWFVIFESVSHLRTVITALLVCPRCIYHIQINCVSFIKISHIQYINMLFSCLKFKCEMQDCKMSPSSG